jgi:rhodanese-related sulfurtransferase
VPHLPDTPPFIERSVSSPFAYPAAPSSAGFESIKSRPKPRERPRPYPDPHSQCDTPAQTQLQVTSTEDGLNYIDSATVAELLNSSSSKYQQLYIIDCRYEFEYQGGHIVNAINVRSPTHLKSLFLQPLPDSHNGMKTCIIFHCEFSQQRGPRTCAYLRKLDREAHGINGFPNLYYPEIYILQGGYKQFYSEYPHLCTPQDYVTMIDPRFAGQLKEDKKEWTKKKKSLERSSSALSMLYESTSNSIASCNSNSVSSSDVHGNGIGNNDLLMNSFTLNMRSISSPQSTMHRF